MIIILDMWSAICRPLQHLSRPHNKFKTYIILIWIMYIFFQVTLTIIGYFLSSPEYEQATTNILLNDHHLNLIFSYAFFFSIVIPFICVLKLSWEIFSEIRMNCTIEQMDLSSHSSLQKTNRSMWYSAIKNKKYAQIFTLKPKLRKKNRFSTRKSCYTAICSVFMMACVSMPYSLLLLYQAHSTYLPNTIIVHGLYLVQGSANITSCIIFVYRFKTVRKSVYELFVKSCPNLKKGNW